MTLNFRSVADAAWTYLIGLLDSIDPETCSHTCIAKETGREKRKIIMREFPDCPKTGELPMYAGTYDVKIYRPDICYVCKKEMN